MTSSKIFPSLLGLLMFLPTSIQAFDYNISSAGDLFLVDVATGIPSLRSLFTGDTTAVSVDGVQWEPSGVVGGDDFVTYTTLLNNEVVATGMINLTDVGRELPTTFEVGNVTVPKSGTAYIEVILEIDGFSASTSGKYQVYAAAVSIIPLIVVLVMALTTHLVELSLFCGVWLGACIITGSLADGFRETVAVFILNALNDWGHVAVILFTVFLSGTVGMMQKSGGMIGFTRDVAKVATTPRLGQAAAFFVGAMIFFDDYSSILLAGETMRPLSDLLSVSREKLSFVVDATSGPVASVSPISSWVGFEVGLLNTELEKITEYCEANGLELTIKDSGFAIFLQSIKYRYYPIFMLVMMMMLIFSQRDFGNMLLAERRVRVYDRTDGGPNKGKVGDLEGAGENQPKEDQPLLAYNMLLPVLILVGLILFCLIRSGDDGSGTQTFMEKIESSDSFIALLYGTMGTAWIMILLYLVQFTIPGTGKLILPTPKVLWDMMPWRKDQVEVQPRFLMSVSESLESFLFGMSRIFLALVVLTLAWASGAVMTAVGCDRLFATFIVGGVPPEMLPTLSFLVSLLMALATGTSWGTMSILFPLILLPTYISSNGNTLIFYSVVAGVLSGAVAGDHMSPISDTTVLSALACDVTLVAHVTTQAPYVLVNVLFSCLFGTLPIGFDAWPNMVGIAIGWLVSLAFVYGVCVPVISPTGRWDPFFKYCCLGRQDHDYIETLTQDCIKKFNGENVELKSADDDDNDEEEDMNKEVIGNEDGMDGPEEEKPPEASPLVASSEEEVQA